MRGSADDGGNVKETLVTIGSREGRTILLGVVEVAGVDAVRPEDMLAPHGRRQRVGAAAIREGGHKGLHVLGVGDGLTEVPGIVAIEIIVLERTERIALGAIGSSPGLLVGVTGEFIAHLQPVSGNLRIEGVAEIELTGRHDVNREVERVGISSIIRHCGAIQDTQGGLTVGLTIGVDAPVAPFQTVGGDLHHRSVAFVIEIHATGRAIAQRQQIHCRIKLAIAGGDETNLHFGQFLARGASCVNAQNRHVHAIVNARRAVVQRGRGIHEVIDRSGKHAGTRCAWGILRPPGPGIRARCIEELHRFQGGFVRNRVEAVSFDGCITQQRIRHLSIVRGARQVGTTLGGDIADGVVVLPGEIHLSVVEATSIAQQEEAINFVGVVDILNRLGFGSVGESRAFGNDNILIHFNWRGRADDLGSDGGSGIRDLEDRNLVGRSACDLIGRDKREDAGGIHRELCKLGEDAIARPGMFNTSARHRIDGTLEIQVEGIGRQIVQLEANGRGIQQVGTARTMVQHRIVLACPARNLGGTTVESAVFHQSQTLREVHIHKLVGQDVARIASFGELGIGGGAPGESRHGHGGCAVPGKDRPEGLADPDGTEKPFSIVSGHVPLPVNTSLLIRGDVM